MQGQSIDFTLIKRLVAEREEFIESGPPARRARLRAMQREIDARLAKAGRRNRLGTAMGMMYESLDQLNAALSSLAGPGPDPEPTPSQGR